LSLYLHVPGDYDRALENTFGVPGSLGVYFGQDSWNPVFLIKPPLHSLVAEASELCILSQMLYLDILT